jgi:hypothetical protein
MNGQDFLRIANDAFAPFLKELGFSMDNSLISGRFYRVSFSSSVHTVWVSYEPGDNTLFVMVSNRQNDKLSDLDDRTKTPRLADLNSRYMQQVTKEERSANEAIFESIVTQDEEERLLLKAAKELRLVLPKYLHSK